MKTKYVLHGGLSAHKNEDNNLFFQEILKDTPETVNVLLVYFAKNEDRIPINREEDIYQFEHNKGAKTLNYTTATEKEFLRQLETADIVYLHGGSSEKIVNALKSYHALEQHFKGKILAADSAGVNALSIEFYSNIYNTTSKGLGIVPFRVICHYHDGDEKKLASSNSIIKELFLCEYKFIVIYK